MFNTINIPKYEQKQTILEQPPLAEGADLTNSPMGMHIERVHAGLIGMPLSKNV